MGCSDPDYAFFNSPRCCCGFVDVLVGVRVIAGLSIIGHAFNIATIWLTNYNMVAVATFDTLFALTYFLFAVLVFVGIENRRPKLLLPFACVQMLHVILGSFIFLIAFVVPFIKPEEMPAELKDIPPLALGIMIGVLGVIGEMIAIWLYAITISAYRVLRKRTIETTGLLNENYDSYA